MSRARELLRRAAEEFADKIYELLRTELLDDLRRELRAGASSPAPAPVIPGLPAAPRVARTPAADRVLAFVAEHPGVAPNHVISALKINRKTVFDALTAACARGELRKERRGRSVAYFAGDAPPASRASAEPPENRRRAAAADIVERVTAFIAEHPGCRYAQIEAALGASEGVLHRAMKEAKQRGTIRMEGTRIKARYFPAGTNDTPREIEPEAVEIPPPPRVPSVRPPRAPSVRPAPPKGTSPADRSKVVALLHELDAAADGDMHALRLGVVLQAIIAEIREVKPRVGPSDPLMGALEHAIRRIGGIRKDRALPFLTGLKRDAEEDWIAIARRSRAKLAAFDRDADEAPKRRSHRPPPSVAAIPRASREVANDADPFPALRAFARDHDVILVGGIKKNEVLDQIRSRYRIDADWAAAQGANARALDAFVDRVKHGRVGAVVVLEGLFGTTQVQTVVAALKAAEVPFAYGGRAGTESLRSALGDLDRALASSRSAAG